MGVIERERVGKAIPEVSDHLLNSQVSIKLLLLMHLPFKMNLWSLSVCVWGVVLDVLYSLFETVNTLKPPHNFCHSQLCTAMYRTQS